MPFPSPKVSHPLTLPDGSTHPTVFLSAAIDHPNWEVGDYSYASAHAEPEDWAMHLAPYLYPGCPEMLRIGRFCQIADGVRFITASANHRRDGVSTYPFAIFDGMDPARPSLPQGPRPDTIIGHDVWIGTRAMIMPGAEIGSGSIIGAGAVVGGQIPPYSIVTGNPGRARPRFSEDETMRLLECAWWDWDIDRIVANEPAIVGADLSVLQGACP